MVDITSKRYSKDGQNSSQVCMSDPCSPLTTTPNGCNSLRKMEISTMVEKSAFSYSRTAWSSYKWVTWLTKWLRRRLTKTVLSLYQIPQTLRPYQRIRKVPSSTESEISTGYSPKTNLTRTAISINTGSTTAPWMHLQSKSTRKTDNSKITEYLKIS